MAFVLKRQAARVLCFNPDGELLMIQAADPADPNKPAWWELPGGGIESGETAAEALQRELREEVGVSAAEIGPCVWQHRAQFTFAGWHFDQEEAIHVATSEGIVDTTPRREAFEALAFRQVRWWNVQELLADPAPTVPPQLRDHLPRLLADGLPDVPIRIDPPVGGNDPTAAPPAP